MKKFTFAKIASLVFVCAMLLCALAVTTLASDEPTVQIVSNNVYFGEKYQLMFAVNAPEGATVSATDAEGNALAVVPFAEAPTATVKGVECDVYVLKEGVAAQAIETVVTFTVEYNETVATKNYSVLQYVYERMNVTNVAEGAELEMFEALLVYAEAADVFLDGTAADQTVSNYKYVSVVDGTLDGDNASGMFLLGTTPFANITATNDYDNTAYNVEWDVSVDGADAVRYDNNEIKALEVSGNTTVTRVLVESQCSHEWSDATCETLSTCSKCGETTGELAPHTWVDATCEAPKTCSVCGETEGEVAEHTWGAWNVTTPATCSKAGEKTRTCTVCENETQTETIPATGAHADATSDGKCDGCGGVIVVSYTLVKDVNNIQVGDKIIIAAAGSNVAMGAHTGGNNCPKVEITKGTDTVTNAGAAQVIVVEAGTTSGTYAFKVSGGYLYAASSGSNHLKVEASKSANSSWAITIDGGVATVKATGSYTRNWMRYNNSNGIFSCYASGQGDIAIYEQTITVTCAHDELTDVETVEPTCTEKGSESGTCVACGEAVVKEIPATGHTEQTVDAVDATCADTGLTEGKICSVCDEVIVAQEIVPATGEHNDGDGNGLCDVCDLDLNTDDAKADKVLAGIEGPVENVNEAGDITLDNTNETGYDATISWAITGGTNTVSTIDGNKLTVALGDSETTLVLTVTVTVGEATVTENYTVNVAAAKVDPVTETIAVAGSTGNLASDSNSISWTNGKVTVVNTKGGTAIRTSDSDHFRAYANSGIKISCNGSKIQTVVITATSSSYAEVIKTAFTNAKYTVSVSGNNVTITVDGNVSEISATVSAQTRFNSVAVTYLP